MEPVISVFVLIFNFYPTHQSMLGKFSEVSKSKTEFHVNYSTLFTFKRIDDLPAENKRQRETHQNLFEGSLTSHGENTT